MKKRGSCLSSSFRVSLHVEKKKKSKKKSKKNYSLSMSLAASPPIDTSVAVFAAMCQNEE